MPFEDSVVFNHPSYALIGLSKITGQRQLFNSPFAHEGFVRLRIMRAEKHRHLSNDWIHATNRKPLIEVDLSHSQFAEFVMCSGVGDGVPCTINTLDGVNIPEPEVENYFETFIAERDLSLQKCTDAFNELDELIASLPMSKKAQSELKAVARKARMSITDSLPFISDQFVEHMEAVTNKAKIEIAAHANSVIHQFGLAALRGENPGIPAFTPPIDVQQLPGSNE